MSAGDCSRRLDQPHKMPGFRVVVLPAYERIAADRATKNRKVRNSLNWDAVMLREWR